MVLCRDVRLVSCTTAVVNGNRGLQRTTSWTAGSGSAQSSVRRSRGPLAANLHPPPSSLPGSFFLICSSWLPSAAAGGGRGDDGEEGSGNREGGREESSLQREWVKELEDENRERECPPSQPGYQERRWVSPRRSRFSFSCHLDQQERKRRLRGEQEMLVSLDVSGCHPQKHKERQKHASAERCSSGCWLPGCLASVRAAPLDLCQEYQTRTQKERRETAGNLVPCLGTGGGGRPAEIMDQVRTVGEGTGVEVKGNTTFSVLYVATPRWRETHRAAAAPFITSIIPFLFPPRLKQTAQHHPAGF